MPGANNEGAETRRTHARMYPILFEIPGLKFPITTFGLMVVLGFLAGSSLFARVGMRSGRDPAIDRGKLDAVPVWGLIGVILGARLMYVTVEMARGTPVGRSFIEKPETVLAVWQGGLVMYGGAFGGLLGGWWATHKHGLDYKHLVDLKEDGSFCPGPPREVPGLLADASLHSLGSRAGRTRCGPVRPRLR